MNKLDHVVNHYRFDASVPSRTFTLMVLTALDLDFDWGEQFGTDPEFMRRMEAQLPLYGNGEHSRGVAAMVPQPLHKFTLSKNDGRGIDNDLECETCGVSISDCGATDASWYCPYNPEAEDNGTEDGKRS